jgi:hypothetical protein
MGGKFRVKAEAGSDCGRRQSCAGTAVEAMNRRVFSSEAAFQIAQNSFLLGRMVVITDNEP